MKRTFLFFALLLVGLLSVFMLSGCSVKNVIEPVNRYFGKEASQEEETAPVNSEYALLSAQVNDSQGRALVKVNGEPLTVMVAYETATGGEPKINSDGIIETYPLGEVVTYAPGSPVINDAGEEETYAGGEVVTDVLGLPEADGNGNVATHAAGEVVTHGPDEVVLDSEGNRRVYEGEPRTYAPGDRKYDTDGELETYPVVIQKDLSGENVTNENGEAEFRSIELVTDASGEPVIETDGEAATRQIDPIPPQQEVDPAIETGEYYINNITSPYVFFSVPEVEASRVAIVADEGVDTSQYAKENGDGTIENLQLEILGDAVPSFDVQTDAQGYAYFVLSGTQKVLTLAGDLRNGVNILLKEMETFPYPQYKYWDEPLYTVADNQKWIIKDNGDGTFDICSYLDENYVMTVDDQYGTQYANIMLWTDEDRDTQRFAFSQDKPVIEQYFEPGEYYISSGLSDWMMISLGDGNYADGTAIYLYPSDQGDGQKFTISYDEYGFATIAHGDSNKVLTVNHSEAINGQGICQWEADGGDWQRWIISPMEHGGYYLRSALNISEVLDLKDADAMYNNSISLHWTNRTMAQSWNFHTEEIPSFYNYATMEEYAQNFSSATDYLILVSSEHNHVCVLQGSTGNWSVVQYWDCVTGKTSTPTVKGEFEITFKTPSFDGNMDSPAWYTVYHASMFYPQYFFHSIIYYQGTMNIMDSSMGYNGSHGCVRLYTDYAEWIYNNVPLHTKVVSY